MDNCKSYFIQQANKYGVFFVRERSPEEDLTGWGALQLVLSNGEIFVISGYQFGQGPGEEGLWVEVHGLNKEAFEELKEKLPPRKAIKDIDIEKSQLEDYLSHHIDEDLLDSMI
jgi:hypothetical protein